MGNCCKYRTLWSWTGEIIYQVLGEKNACPFSISFFFFANRLALLLEVKR